MDSAARCQPGVVSKAGWGWGKGLLPFGTMTGQHRCGGWGGTREDVVTFLWCEGKGLYEGGDRMRLGQA